MSTSYQGSSSKQKRLFIALRFLYLKSKDDISVGMDDLLAIIALIVPEKNSLVNKYSKAGVKVTSALHSQALLTLHKNYCVVGKCLRCSIGASLLGS